jgi:Flp pilus assembly pilin Flp
MPIKLLIKRIFGDQTGATAIEYALLIAILGLGVITIGNGMGDAYKFMWELLDTEIDAVV